MSDNGLELFDLNAYLASESKKTQNLKESYDEVDNPEEMDVEEDKLITQPDSGVEDGDRVSDEDDMSAELEEFCLQCMRMYVNVHLWHLQTGSYAEHEALQDYYEGLFEQTDDFIESAIATSGAIACDTSYNFELLPYGEMLEEIEAFKEHVEAQKEQQSEDGLVNILEDMLSTTDKVLFKLKNLK